MYSDTRLFGADTDLDELLNKLKTPWKTMDSDMDTALGIITNHAKTEFESKKVQLINIAQRHDGDISIKFPGWQADIEKTFIHQYGLIDGKLIFNKVLMRLFQMSKGTQQQLH